MKGNGRKEVSGRKRRKKKAEVSKENGKEKIKTRRKKEVCAQKRREDS